MTWDYYQRQIITQLNRIETKIGVIMSQQDEINADVTELQAAAAAIIAEITKLEAAQAAGQPLDLAPLKAAVDAVSAIAPPAAP